MSTNRMFVNPNFISRKIGNSKGTASNMHINPNFQGVIKPPFEEKNTQENVAKVYINPNFRNLPTSSEQSEHLEPYVNTGEKIEEKAKPFTVKLNKYKSISVPVLTQQQKTDFIKNFKSNLPQKRETVIVKKLNVLNVKFTNSSTHPYCPPSTVKHRKPHNSSKLPNMTWTPNESKLKCSKTVNQPRSKKCFNLKKINVKCPLVIKHGKCLKFEKGFCRFDHEVAPSKIKMKVSSKSEKREACRFYSDGRCTKTDCQYSHIHCGKEPKDEKNDDSDQEPKSLSRYFTSEKMDELKSVSLPTSREKLGQLPSYIKFS